MSDSFILKPINPIATVLTHLRLIALVSILGTVTLGVLVLLRVRPSYMAEAAIELTLIHNRIWVWDQEKQFSSRTQYTDWVNTQIAYITGDDTIRAALEKIPLPNAALIPGKNETETLFRFRSMMNIRPVFNTHLVTISMESSQPKDLALMVNELVDAFMERTEKFELGLNDTRVLYLRDELAQRTKQLDEKYRALAEFTRNLETYNFTSASNPYDLNLRSLREALQAAHLETLEAETSYSSLAYSTDKEKELGVKPYVEEFVYRDLNTVEMKNLTFETQKELNRQSTFLKPEHPSSKRLEKHSAASREYLDEALRESYAAAAEIFEGKMALDHATRLARAEGEMMAKRELERELAERFELGKRELIQTTPDFLKASQIRSEIERLEERIAGVESRLDDLILEAKAPGRLRIQSRAVDPLYPSKDRRKLMLLAVCFLSVAAALFLAFVIDFLDPRLVDVGYISKLIGQRPTGVLSHAENAGDFGHLLRALPKSYHADQFRRIMPRIFSPKTGDGPPKTLTLVGLTREAGTTALALNTLTYLERLGKKAALLEVAPPSAQSVLQRAAPAEPGAKPVPMEHQPGISLGRVATREGSDLYAFTEDYDPNLVTNGETLNGVCRGLAQDRDHLLLDAPPLLEHAGGETLCRMADVTLLVVSSDNHAGELRQGLALLEDIGIKKCAVIINKLPSLPGGTRGKAMAAFRGESTRFYMVTEVIYAVGEALGISRERLKPALRRFTQKPTERAKAADHE